MGVQITDKIRAITTFILVLFCIQYIPLESRDGVSYLKVVTSFLCIFLLLKYPPKIDKTVLLFGVYYCLVSLAAISHPDTLRWSTVLFLLSFIIVYVSYYSLLEYHDAFDLNYFKLIIERLIIAYFIVLVIQQCCLLIGVRYLPLINLVQYLDRGLGANSLTYEPSSAAIILSFAYMSLIRLNELEIGHKVSIKELFNMSKWASIGFIWCMITMGSASAFLGLGIISLYFISKRQLFPTITLIIAIILIFYYVDFTPLNRLKASIEATLTLDNSKVMAADGSAAARIVPIVNTITKLDLLSWDGWFGHGVDYGLSKWIFSDRVMIGGIADYGLLSFIVMQMVVYSCMIRKFFSIETLLWFILGMGTLANVPINWGAMMLFTGVKYFTSLQYNIETNTDECD